MFLVIKDLKLIFHKKTEADYMSHSKRYVTCNIKYFEDGNINIVITEHSKNKFYEA